MCHLKVFDHTHCLPLELLLSVLWSSQRSVLHIINKHRLCENVSCLSAGWHQVVCHWIIHSADLFKNTDSHHYRFGFIWIFGGRAKIDTIWCLKYKLLSNMYRTVKSNHTQNHAVSLNAIRILLHFIRHLYGITNRECQGFYTAYVIVYQILFLSLILIADNIQ